MEDFSRQLVEVVYELLPTGRVVTDPGQLEELMTLAVLNCTYAEGDDYELDAAVNDDSDYVPDHECSEECECCETLDSTDEWVLVKAPLDLEI